MNNNYEAVVGDMMIQLQVRWHGQSRWQNIGKEVSFVLSEEIAQNWNNQSPPMQVASVHFMELRG